MKLDSKSAILSLRRALRSKDTGDFSYSAVSKSYGNAKLLVQVFYLCSVYITATLLDTNDKDLFNVTEWDLLWPLFWVDLNNIGFQMRVVGAIAFTSSVLAVFFSGSVVIRLIFSIFFLLSGTLTNSYAGINHAYHAWFWISFVFIFLPSGATWRSAHTKRSHMMSYLTVFLAAQVLMMLFYTLSGTWKFMYGIRAIFEGLDGIFTFRGLSYNLANRVLQTNTDPLLAKFAIDNYMIAWLGVMGVLFIQITAIVAAFRPRLHVLWGLGIAMFHFGTWLLMGIVFTTHILLLMMLFVLSPFRPAEFDLRKTILDLPIIGKIAGLLLNGFPKPSAIANER